MEMTIDCWAGCGEEFTAQVNASRGSDAITDGIPVQCTLCGYNYKFTLDGDGEPDLEPLDNPEKLGDNVDDVKEGDSTNF